MWMIYDDNSKKTSFLSFSNPCCQMISYALKPYFVEEIFISIA